MTTEQAPRVARLDDPGQRGAPAHRAAAGKAARHAVPRDAHATFEPRPDRPDPVDLLEQQGSGRVADLLPIRYGRMLASPLAYLRGAALPMAADLSGTPVTGLTVQLCGDAHLANFGIFASPERRLVFDINDFDETLPGPWEWDVKRLAASLEVAGRSNGFSAAERRRIVIGAAGHYRLSMRKLAGLGDLDVWYSHGELDELAERYKAVLTERERELAGEDLSAVGRSAAPRPASGSTRGRRATAASDAKAAPRRPAAADLEMRQLARLVTTAAGSPGIVSAPPLTVPVSDLPADERAALSAELNRVVTGYRDTVEAGRRYLVSGFRVADAARKIVGVGSVGMRCWIVLLTGRDDTDLLFLQLKEAQPSVLSTFAGASEYGNQGQRVVAGQHLMQAASDTFLGWHHSDAPDGQGQGADYYVRQLRDWKFSVATDQMRPETMQAYAALCGRTLARAHARSGDRIAIGAYLGGSAEFETAIAEFAVHYADQNDRDYALLRAAVSAGRLPATEGV